jgi:hypothetical protein
VVTASGSQQFKEAESVSYLGATFLSARYLRAGRDREFQNWLIDKIAIGVTLALRLLA